MQTNWNKVKELLKDRFCYFKDENVLVVSEDKATLPYLFIISDDNFPNALLVSFAVDYPYSADAAQFVLDLNAIKKVQVMEDFFIGKNGITYWGEQAHYYYEIEASFDLNDCDPLHDTQH